MSIGKLDLSDLGGLVAAERSKRGLSLRDAAVALDIPFNTLARVEKGHVPDLPKFKRLVEWCGADIQQFFEATETTSATTDAIAEHLHADRSLPPEAANQIAGIVNELYQALARPQTAAAVHLRAARTFRPDAARALGELISEMNESLVKESGDAPPQRI